MTAGRNIQKTRIEFACFSYHVVHMSEVVVNVVDNQSLLVTRWNV